ncbi:hypothetical protein [Vibrio sp. 10N]|uniref:hypothetical protein n=1 Tax=Vibrio sp. 10N TaxID=3058938 RepID=UPI0030C676A0
MKIRLLISTVTIGLASSLIGHQVEAAPSMGLVLPGGWQAWGSRAKEIQQWESQNSDIVFGSLGSPELNKQTTALGYMYSQKLDCFAGEQEAWLHRQLWQQGINPEHLYLHAAQETHLAYDHLSEKAQQFLDGKPLHMMVKKGTVLQTARLPLKLSIDEELIVVTSQPFVAINVPSTDTLSISLAKPEQVGASITEWQPLAIDESDVSSNSNTETLLNLTIDQQMLAVTPWLGEYHFNTGHHALDLDMPVYMARLSWSTPQTIDALSVDYGLRQEAKHLVILGWDWRNDANGDGYLDDDEYRQRTNLEALARYASQARLIPIGNMWPGTCWQRTNFSHPAANQAHMDWYKYDWHRQGLSGAYNDDMAKLLGGNQYQVFKGGAIAELPGTLGTDEAALNYAGQMASFLSQLKDHLPNTKLAANISELNLWRYPQWTPELRSVFDVWLREHYLYAAMGTDALRERWEHFALSAMGDVSLVMTTTRLGRSEGNISDEQAWQQDIATGLALYYLFHIPNQTHYHSWNQTFYYSSGPTDDNNWHQSGAVKNQVYRPTDMLSHDLGEPITETDSSFDWLTQDRAEAKQVEQLLKSNRSGWFWLDSDDNWFWPKKYKAIGRRFEHGIVVYLAGGSRADSEMWRDEAAWSEESQAIRLPAQYQRVNWDGSLAPKSNRIELRPYEGAVLIAD